MTPVPSLPDLAARINVEHAACLASARHAITRAVEVGRLLTEAKGQLAHGEWIPWVEANLEFNRVQAWKYMRAYDRREMFSPTEHFGGLEGFLKCLSEPKPTVDRQLDSAEPAEPGAMLRILPAGFAEPESTGILTEAAIVGTSARILAEGGDPSEQDEAVDLTKPTMETAEAAGLLKVSKGYVAEAEKIKDGSPETFEDVKAGKLSLPEAKKKVGRTRRAPARPGGAGPKTTGKRDGPPTGLLRMCDAPEEVLDRRVEVHSVFADSGNEIWLQLHRAEKPPSLLVDVELTIPEAERVLASLGRAIRDAEERREFWRKP
jgi:hypothetical protein